MSTNSSERGRAVSGRMRSAELSYFSVPSSRWSAFASKVASRRCYKPNPRCTKDIFSHATTVLSEALQSLGSNLAPGRLRTLYRGPPWPLSHNSLVGARMYSVRLFLLPAVLLPVAAQSPLICEDSINNHAPFDFNDVPCLLGCGMQISRPTGSLLPGSVNETDIPYCRLNCVHKDVTPAQSSAAPSCNSKCENGNGATPDQLGWCMYWCKLIPRQAHRSVPR